MTKIPYIDCALEAALAAKNHGFRFVREHGKEIEHYDLVNLELMFPDGITSKIYIHPDSMGLLDALPGDLVYTHCQGDIDRYATVGENTMYLHTRPSPGRIKEIREGGGIATIIQRQGKAFPDIQWEEVE